MSQRLGLLCSVDHYCSLENTNSTLKFSLERLAIASGPTLYPVTRAIQKLGSDIDLAHRRGPLQASLAKLMGAINKNFSYYGRI
ncbi:hypothetical protein CEY11_09110 [Candidimonas nitroreducens]|uniref:Uncharacterized protein n=1 Tax=Candidimonas nitroreducens TaxID=683354 RepID=A0A225MKW7_9BURK|nr:hypothetical protein CEY11_09110 [Candidimonas nitroreducens]